MSTRLKDLESRIHEPTTLNLAERMSQKLDSLDADFKEYHYALINVIDEIDMDSLVKEQETLDQHDEDISYIAVRIEQVIATCNLASDSGARKTD